MSSAWKELSWSISVLGSATEANNKWWVARHCQKISGIKFWTGTSQEIDLKKKNIQRIYQCLDQKHGEVYYWEVEGIWQNTDPPWIRMSLQTGWKSQEELAQRGGQEFYSNSEAAAGIKYKEWSLYAFSTNVACMRELQEKKHSMKATRSNDWALPKPTLKILRQMRLKCYYLASTPNNISCGNPIQLTIHITAFLQ